MPGGKYGSVTTAEEFERGIGHEFCHDVVPIAFDINVSLGQGWAIERACGSAELNSLVPGTSSFRISSEFASPHSVNSMARGGIICFKLRPPPAPSASSHHVGQAAPRRSTRHSKALDVSTSDDSGGHDAASLALSATWKTLDGKQGMHGTTLPVPPSGPTTDVASASLRKAIALVRFVDLQTTFCNAGEEDATDLDGRLSRLATYRAGRDELVDEMAALGDATILDGGTNYSFLQTLEQIIELETTETNALVEHAKADATATSSSAASSVAARLRKRKRDGGASSSPPKELICPILHTLMTDPVSTVDGHTFEREAIAKWLEQHSTSPLTGLRLASKALTPNHSLRSLAEAFTGR